MQDRFESNTQLWNAALAAFVLAVPSLFPGASVVSFDAHTLFTSVSEPVYSRRHILTLECRSSQLPALSASHRPSSGRRAPHTDKFSTTQMLPSQNVYSL